MRKIILRQLISHAVFFGSFGLILFAIVRIVSFVNLEIFSYSQVESNESVAFGVFFVFIPLFWGVISILHPAMKKKFPYLSDIKL